MFVSLRFVQPERTRSIGVDEAQLIAKETNIAGSMIGRGCCGPVVGVVDRCGPVGWISDSDLLRYNYEGLIYGNNQSRRTVMGLRLRYGTTAQTNTFTDFVLRLGAGVHRINRSFGPRWRSL